ncbi:MAG TPA: DUF350 domain-containing protein [Burkholderiales bacterium]|nr:DUF350 domain-containing protein [Burkholderiales bacterium]
MEQLFMHWLAGVPPFLLYFVTAVALLVAFTVVYISLTPYHEIRLIQQGNAAAAASLAGAMLGFSLPLAHSVAQSANLADMALWGVTAAIVQLATYFVVHLLIPSISRDIPEGRVAQGVFLGAVSVTTGILNAACMTS